MANFLEAYNIKPKMASNVADKPKINLFDFSQKPMIQPTTQKSVGFTGGGRGATSLFSDEQNAFNNMLNDGIDEKQAREVITNRRKKLLGEISQEESGALSKMIEDGLDTTTAVGIITKRRERLKKEEESKLPLANKIGLGATRFTGSVLAGGVGEVGGITDFVTGGNELSKQAMEGRETQRQINPGISGKVGELIGGGAVDYGVGLGAGKVAGLGSKFNKLSTGKQLVTGGAGYGALTAVGEKGSETTAGDIAMGAGIGAGAGLALGKVVIPAITGTVQKGMKYGTALQKGGIEGLGKSIGRDIKAPIKTIQTKGIAPNIAYSQSTKANRFNAKDIEDFKKITGEDPGEWAVKRGMTKVGDDAVDEATKLWKQSIKEADDGLGLIQGTYKQKGDDYMGEMLNDLSERLGKTLSKGKNRVNQLMQKYNTEGLTMSEINEIKRLYSKNYKYTWVDAGSENALRSKNLQDGVREWQFKVAEEQGLSNLKDINKTTQGWKTFADNLAKKLKRSEGNNNVSITDWIALSGGEPTNVALFLGKQVGKLDSVKSGIIKTLGKQTKPSIIKANKENILKANAKKQYDNTANILRNRYNIGVEKPIKLLGPGTAPASENVKTIILPSKKAIKTPTGTIGKAPVEPKPTKAPLKPTILKKTK